jgi:ribosomal protein S18 acetylase RimI-like enzyme
MSALAKQTPSLPTIRAATDADVLQMAKVHITSWRETYPGLLPDSMLARLSIAEEAIRWQRMLDHPRERSEAAFVAELEGLVVGYGSCGGQRTPLLRERGFTAEIGELYVLGFAHRRGFGSGLMKAMAEMFIERGHRAMSLWVLEENSRARRFYEGLGGTAIAKKRATLAEVAYGWTDLKLLQSATVRSREQ